jgi:Domain of unknown function (DUF1963)
MDRDDLTDRRGLLRKLAARVADGAKEIAGAAPEPDPHEPGAQLPDAALTIGEVLELATEHGLAARLDDVRRLCRASARLAPAPSDAEVRSHAGGGASPPEVEVPLWSGGPLPLVARIDLAEAAAAADVSPLPRDGTIWVFCDRDAVRSGRDGAACRVLFDDSQRPHAPGARALATAGELVLPRVWSERVAALELSAEEHAGWEALRHRIAAAQGVEPFDADPWRPVHRLLGWPDERGGWMPLACAMLDAAVDLGSERPPAHPPTPELAAASARWRLLIQVSADPALDPGWRGARERLYLWSDERALAEHDLTGVRAFVQ